MMVVAHVAVGAALGALTGDPIAGLVVGTASHFVLDATPHPEFVAWRWVAAADLPRLTVEFKRTVYERVVAEFRSFAT